jgi:hypothetical protein
VGDGRSRGKEDENERCGSKKENKLISLIGKGNFNP